MQNVLEQMMPARVGAVDNFNVTIFSAQCLGQEIVNTHSATASAVWTANRLIFLPFVVTRPTLVSKFYWANGAAVNGNTDVGIYDTTGTTKLGSTGSTANSGTSALQIVNVADFFLPQAKWLWLALGCDSSTQQYHRLATSATHQDFLGIKEQLSGWSSGLPSSVTFGTPTIAVVPVFGFTGQGAF